MSRVTLNSNSASLTAQRRLGESTSALGGSFERLASGLRVNRASDDAAGLAIAAGLNVDARVYAQGVRNLNDGISYLNVAEGATVELKGVLFRLRELATQSSNGTLGNTQRQALDEEAQALLGEYNRIVATTSFNGWSIFAPENSELALQAGYGQGGAIRLSLEATTTRVVGDGTFQDRTSYDTGTAPQDVILGDLNGDGILDVVNTDVNANTLSVRLGNGDGTFETRSSYATGGGPRSVSLGDLNGDGVLDVVNTDFNANTLSVRLGNGDGTFQSRTTYATGTAPWGLTLGDLNGDGVLDVVNTDSSSNTLRVHLGNGDGTFQAPTTNFATDVFPLWVVLGDLNGDGVLDVVNSHQLSNTLRVRLGNGDGTFQAPTDYAAGPGPREVALGDLNGDGVLDLINADSASNSLSVRLGNGDGTFQARAILGTGLFPYSVVLGDLNGDGVLDVVNTDSNSNTLSVHLGNGDGTFQSRTTYTTGSSPRFVALGDLNGDGVLDLINADLGSNSLSVRLANTTATISVTTTFIAIDPISGISVATQASALSAQWTIDGHLDTINQVAGLIGASQSRLEAAAEMLRVTSENYRAAESRIVDADIAEESANLVRNQILQQAGAAVLGQANQLPALALQLLRQN